MRQVLHRCATTTYAVRAAIQRSKASVAELADQYGVNQKTVRKWRSRKSIADAPTGSREVRSTVLTPEEEAVCVTFRKHTFLPLDDCLYALQATIPHLTRSSLHRLFQRHDISRLPDVDGEKKQKKKFKKYPVGYFHIDIAEVRTEEGELHMFVALDRTSKFAYVELHKRAMRKVVGNFLRKLIEVVPYKVHTVLTDSGTHFTDPKGESWTVPEMKDMLARKELFRSHSLDLACAQNDIDRRLTKPSLDKWPGRTNEPDPERSDGQAILIFVA